MGVNTTSLYLKWGTSVYFIFHFSSSRQPFSPLQTLVAYLLAMDNSPKTHAKRGAKDMH